MTTTQIKATDIYVGCGRGRDSGTFVLGHAFGPCMLATRCTLEEAIDEFDERYGERVSVTDSALADYPGETISERVEAALAEGDTRCNYGGTTVWVDHYEWVRQFATVRQAGRFFRGEWNDGTAPRCPHCHGDHDGCTVTTPQCAAARAAVAEDPRA